MRHAADEAVGGRPLRIDLQVRRLYCEYVACPKTAFAEQVPGLTRRYQRRTPVLQRVVDAVAVAVAVAGSAGAVCCRCCIRHCRGRCSQLPDANARALLCDTAGPRQTNLRAALPR
jgi:hypothetical protein